MSKYLPPLSQITRDAISTGIALIVVAWIIAKNPGLKRLVKDYQAD